MDDDCERRLSGNLAGVLMEYTRLENDLSRQTCQNSFVPGATSKTEFEQRKTEAQRMMMTALNRRRLLVLAKHSCVPVCAKAQLPSSITFVAQYVRTAIPIEGGRATPSTPVDAPRRE